jgi:hypothetical protein
MNALFDYPDSEGNREIYTPLAAELRRQEILMREFEEQRTSYEQDTEQAIR